MADIREDYFKSKIQSQWKLIGNAAEMYIYNIGEFMECFYVVIEYKYNSPLPLLPMGVVRED